MDVKKWKVAVNNRCLSLGSEYEWVEGKLKFRFALGPFVNIEVRGPGGSFCEVAPGSTPAGQLVYVPLESQPPVPPPRPKPRAAPISETSLDLKEINS